MSASGPPQATQATQASPHPAVARSVQGVFFDGFSSRDHDATLHLGTQTVTLSVPSLNLTQTWQAEQVRAEPAIPGVRRTLKFADGSRFETRDDAAITAWERGTGQNRMLGGVRGLESRWSTALISLVVAVAATGLFVVFGIPALARQAATATPRSVLETFDRETMDLLENGGYIGPSTLSAARQAALQREFRRVAAWAGGDYPYRLLLRDGEPGGSLNELGANAFALPNGTIVMTDQLVALAKNDRELIGVLAHETGHVTRRHGLAGVYQALGLTLVTTVITGDLVSASTFAAAVPAALLRGGYSRAAETESDKVAGAYMMQEYGTTKPLQDILGRLEDQDKSDQSDGAGDPNTQPSPDPGERQGSGGKAGSGGSVLDLLNTHPGTANRIEHLKSIEAAGTTPP